MGDLMGIVGGGQTGADVKELPDARVADQVGHRAYEERPLGAGEFADA